MASLTKTLILFVLITNIVYVICHPKRRFGLKGKSTNLIINQPQKSEFDIEVYYCKLQVHLLFQMETGLENFMHAFLNINVESLLSSEHFTDTLQSYYYHLYHSARDKNPLRVLTPHEFCQKNYNPNREVYNKCLSTIVATGCNANDEGNACILHLYLNYKKPDEFYPGSVRGTGDLTDEDLSNAYYRGIDFPDDYTDKNLLEDYYKEMGRFDMLSRNSSSSSISSRNVRSRNSPSSSFSSRTSSSSFPGDGNYLEYLLHSYELSTSSAMETQRNNDLLEARYRSYGIRDIPYEDIREEFRRRQFLPKVYDYYYVVYLHNEILYNSDWTFDNRHEFCKNYVAAKQANESNS